MEDKLKYFLIGLMMLLVVVMFKDNFAYDTNFAYDNCDHYYQMETHNDQVTQGYYDSNNTWVAPTYNSWSENVLKGNGTWTHTDPNEYWWFTSADLLEFHPKDAENADYYYCMFAGKSMNSFEHNPGWVTHVDPHDSNNKEKHWTTNYHWEKGFNNTAKFEETPACMMYNYKVDPNSETKRGRLGVQGVIWAEGSTTR